jgi:carboxypeptidase Taq
MGYDVSFCHDWFELDKERNNMTSTSSAPQTMDQAAATPYHELIDMVKQASLLSSSAALVSWDQEVMMPKGGLEHRSRQLAQLASLCHEMSTSPRIGELLETCEQDSALMADPLSPEAVNVREIRRTYDRKTKLPTKLVEEEATLSSQGMHAWAEARKNSDFAAFEPWLAKIVKLLQRKAECFVWESGGEPWDALAEDYEPGCTAKQVAELFAPLRVQLQDLLSDLMASSTKPSNAFNEAKLPVEQQEKFVRFVAESIGFDFNRGRLDRSTHPFCSGTHCNDVRLTTRFAEYNVNDALGSTMHEAGHGIYEQGLLEEHIGTPMGHSVSLGIHESQSRMWENQVGRSREFWVWLYPKLKDFFGDAISHLSIDDIYGGANIVKPDFIRVEADEATYNMHIMIRFEIERAIMKGDLPVKDIPGVWNEKYKEYLDLDVPDDRRGCLQDVHWSMTSMGYFPTYTLGNLYCAQLFEKAQQDMPDLLSQFERGEFGNLKTWLNTNVHAHGQRYHAADLCEHVTGKPLTAEPLLRHLSDKLRPIYGL